MDSKYAILWYPKEPEPKETMYRSNTILELNIEKDGDATEVKRNERSVSES